MFCVGSNASRWRGLSGSRSTVTVIVTCFSIIVTTFRIQTAPMGLCELRKNNVTRNNEYDRQTHGFVA